MKKAAIISSVITCILLIALMLSWVFSFEIALILNGLRPDKILEDRYDKSGTDCSIRVVAVDNRKMSVWLKKNALGVWYVFNTTDRDPYNERGEQIIEDILDMLTEPTTQKGGE